MALEKNDLKKIGKIIDESIDSIFDKFDKKNNLRFIEFEKKIDSKFDKFEKKTDLRFLEFEDSFNSKFGGINEKLDRIEKKVDRIWESSGEDLMVTTKLIQKLARRLIILEKRINKLEKMK